MLALLLLGPPADGGGNPLGMFLPLILIFVVFYFFLIRPQKKKEQKRKEMIQNVAKGDKIVTIGGVHGTVTQIEEGSVLAQVDTNTKLRIDKNAIASVLSKES